MSKKYKFEINCTGSEHVYHYIKGQVFTLEDFIGLLKQKDTTMRMWDVSALKEITNGSTHLDTIIKL